MPRFLVKVVVEAEINGLLEATDLAEAKVKAASEPLDSVDWYVHTNDPRVVSIEEISEDEPPTRAVPSKVK